MPDLRRSDISGARAKIPTPGRRNVVVAVHGSGKTQDGLLDGTLDVVGSAARGTGRPIRFSYRKGNGYIWAARHQRDMEEGGRDHVGHAIRMKKKDSASPLDIHALRVTAVRKVATSNGVDWMIKK